MAELYIKPRPGDVIRDPASGRIVPPEGEAKPRNPHWLRRLSRGEVAETTAEDIAKGKEAREAAEAAAAKAAEEAATAAQPAPAAEAPPPTPKARKGSE